MSILNKIKKAEQLRQETALVSDLYFEQRLNLSEIGARLGKSLTWVTARLNRVYQYQKRGQNQLK